MECNLIFDPVFYASNCNIKLLFITNLDTNNSSKIRQLQNAVIYNLIKYMKFMRPDPSGSLSFQKMS